MPRRNDIKKILIVGSGPIVIGQACEFDYSGTQACKALRKLGYEVVLVNSNPATIMTDPEMHFIGACDYMYLAPAEIAEDCREADAACAILGVGKTYGAASFSAVSEEFERCGVELCDVIIVSDFNTESIRDKS